MLPSESRRPRPSRASRVIKTALVLPNDTNNHHTLFGGKLMAYIDDVAAISAMRHCHEQVVTASTDSIDFLRPINQNEAVILESFVTWTGTSSMEVFIKVFAEDLLSGERRIAATAFSTFVALDKNFKPVRVPPVYPETDEEKALFDSAPNRVLERQRRRVESRKMAELIETMSK
ncbi:MAG: acyl-CoA thioesterase [Candidatus Carbobacillus sp.]|nr:acyl-CoA thioesterase [Candidatus Carbobacillus sp.]